MAEPYTTIRLGGDRQLLGFLKRLPEFYDQASFFFDWIFLSLIFGFILGEGFKKANLPKKAGAIVGTVMGFGLAYSLAKKGSSIGEYSPMMAFFATVLFVVVCYAWLRHNFFRENPVTAFVISLILGILALSGLYSIVDLGDPLNSVISGIFTILFIVMALALLLALIAGAAHRGGAHWPGNFLNWLRGGQQPHQQLQQAGQGAGQAGQGAQGAQQAGQQAGQGAQQAQGLAVQIQQGIVPLQNALAQLAQAIAAMAARGFPPGAGGGGGGGGGAGPAGPPGPVGPGGGVPPGGPGGGWPGPRGPAGPAGPRGVPGRPPRLPPSPLAPPGAPGATGTQGMPGTPGQQGPAGQAGAPGTTGTGGGGPVNITVQVNPQIIGARATGGGGGGGGGAKATSGGRGRGGRQGEQGPPGMAGTPGAPGQIPPGLQRQVDKIEERQEQITEWIRQFIERQKIMSQRTQEFREQTKNAIILFEATERGIQKAEKRINRIQIIEARPLTKVKKEEVITHCETTQIAAEQARALLTTAEANIEQLPHEEKGLRLLPFSKQEYPIISLKALEIAEAEKHLNESVERLRTLLAVLTSNPTQENLDSLQRQLTDAEVLCGKLEHLMEDVMPELKQFRELFMTNQELARQAGNISIKIKKELDEAAEKTEELERLAKLREEITKWTSETRKTIDTLFKDLNTVYFNFPNNPALRDLGEKKITAPLITLKLLFKSRKDEADKKINTVEAVLNFEVAIANTLKDECPEFYGTIHRLIRILDETKAAFKISIEKNNLELLSRSEIEKDKIGALINRDDNFKAMKDILQGHKNNAEEAIKDLENIVNAKTR